MSPKLTSEQLKKAKARKKKEREEELKRLRIAAKERIKARIRYEQISSELDGLYQELDKIYKKAPAEPISDLTVENVNNLIRDTKEVIQGDPYLDRIKEFVPAGDNPEYRDVIIVLRQLRQSMDRFKKSYYPMYKSLSDLVDELEELEAEDS